MAGSITVQGASMGLPDGEHIFGPVTVIGTVVIESGWAGTLSTGDTTIVVPAGAVFALVTFPSSLTGTVKLRTNLNSTDVGLPVMTPVTGSQELPMAFPLASGTTSLILNGSGTLTGTTSVTFI